MKPEPAETFPQISPRVVTPCGARTLRQWTTHCNGSLLRPTTPDQGLGIDSGYQQNASSGADPGLVEDTRKDFVQLRHKAKWDEFHLWETQTQETKTRSVSWVELREPAMCHCVTCSFHCPLTGFGYHWCCWHHVCPIVDGVKDILSRICHSGTLTTLSWRLLTAIQEDTLILRLLVRNTGWNAHVHDALPIEKK